MKIKTVTASVEAVNRRVCAVFSVSGRAMAANVGTWAAQVSKDVSGGHASGKIVAADTSTLPLGLGAEAICKHVRDMCATAGYAFKW